MSYWISPKQLLMKDQSAYLTLNIKKLNKVYKVKKKHHLIK